MTIDQPQLVRIDIKNLMRFKETTFSFHSSHCTVHGESESGKTSLVIAMRLFGFAMNNCYRGKWVVYEASSRELREILGMEYITHRYGNSKNKASITGNFSTGVAYTFHFISFRPLKILPDSNMPPVLKIYFTLIKNDKVIEDQNTVGYIDRQLVSPNQNFTTMISYIQNNSEMYKMLIGNVKKIFPEVEDIGCRFEDTSASRRVFISTNLHPKAQSFSMMGRTFKSILLVFATILYDKFMWPLPLEGNVFLIDNLQMEPTYAAMLCDALLAFGCQIIMTTDKFKITPSGYTSIMLGQQSLLEQKDC
jgi:hypothetical protein